MSVPLTARPGCPAGFRKQAAQIAMPRWIRTPLAAVLLAAGLSGGSLPDGLSAYGATFEVRTFIDAPHTLPLDGACTSTLPDNPCSLRAAVQAANFLGGAHTITLPAGTFSLTVTGADEDGAAAGDLDVTAGTLTIQGAGSVAAIIDAAGLGDRVFDLQPGAAANLLDVTVQNGAPGIADGGGIRVQADATLSVANATLKQNLARNRRGGAIFNDGTTTLTNTTLHDNSTGPDLSTPFPFSGDGGGVYNGATRTLTLTSSILSSNRSRRGGGVFNAGGTVMMTFTAINFNDVGELGGGIYNSGGSLTINLSSVGSNRAARAGAGPEGQGAGLWNGGTLTVTNSAIMNNIASAESWDPNSGPQGGGLRNAANAHATLVNTLISGNFLIAGIRKQGGGVYNAGTLDLTNVTLTGNKPSTSGGGNGAALFNAAGGTARLFFVTIARNTSFETNGAQVENLGALQIGSSIIALPLSNSGGATNCIGTTGSSVGYNIEFPLGFGGVSTCAFTTAEDYPGVDPLLGPLANNGGPTQTIALLPFSPAIDAGHPTCPLPATDQRGFVRPGGARCDVGAFEVRLPTAAAPMDFNGDGVSDLTVWRPPDGTWYIDSIANVPWGDEQTLPVPEDYNGDGATDIAVWRPADGMWLVKDQFTVQWGGPAYVPVPGDYDGDGKADVAVWEPATGVWHIHGQGTVQWGGPSYAPVPGDYDGDGTTDIAVWEPATGVWYIWGQGTVQWGGADYIPVPGDYDGDGTTDIAVWLPSEGMWYVKGQFSVQWGRGDAGDIPVPGDYDGDGTIDVAVWRPTDGVWYVKDQFEVSWGRGDMRDLPLERPNAWFLYHP